MIAAEPAPLRIDAAVMIAVPAGTPRRGRIVTYRDRPSGRVFSVKTEDGEIVAGLTEQRMVAL